MTDKDSEQTNILLFMVFSFLAGTAVAFHAVISLHASPSASIFLSLRKLGLPFWQSLWVVLRRNVSLLDGYSPVLKNSSSVLVDLLSVLHATNRLDIFFASYPHEAHAWKDIGAFFTNILLYLPRWFIAYVMLCGSHVKRVLLGERNCRDWKKKMDNEGEYGESRRRSPTCLP
jgi:hypothetical protein